MPTTLIASPTSVVEDVLNSLKRTTSPKVARQESGNGLNASILILEETPDIGVMMELILKAKRYDAWYRPHSFQGIQFARQFRPQVILVNLGGPKCLGVQTCQTLREYPETAGCAIVIMTVDPMELYERFVVGAGATLFVPKKLGVNELVKIVEDALKANE